MARLILHGGTGKTGSTSIQTALATNQELLASMGVRALASNRSHPHRSAKHRLAWRDETDASWIELRNELDQVRDTDDTFILSNESVFSLKDTQLMHLASQLEGFEVATLVYVREQTDYLQTLLLQHQKRQERQIDLFDKASVDEWLKRRLRVVDYNAMGERFESYFGEGSFHARVFDRSMLVDNDLLTDFFTAIGIQDTTGLETSVKANSSLNPKYAAVIREHREQLMSAGREIDVLDLAIRLSKNDDSPRWFLPESETTRVQEMFEESNRSFFARFVRNGGAFPQKQTFRPADAEAFDTKALADEMHALLVSWPQLRLSGWNKKAGSARRYFQEGWHVLREDGGAVSVKKQESAAVVRFRLPDRKRGQWSIQGLELIFGVKGEPVAQHLDINGTSLGTIMVGAGPIEIDFALLGNLDQAELTFTGIDGVDEFEVISMDVTMPESDDIPDEDD